MVSLGDAVISLHTLQLQLGEGDSRLLRTQSPKFWPTFHWGEGILDYSKLKVPSSGQLFIWGESILDYSQLKVPSFSQLFIGGGYSRLLKTQSPQF